MNTLDPKLLKVVIVKYYNMHMKMVVPGMKILVGKLLEVVILIYYNWHVVMVVHGMK
jgi:hypothetical protein